jgi:hypothetical protein
MDHSGFGLICLYITSFKLDLSLLRKSVCASFNHFHYRYGPECMEIQRDDPV